jgi:hypothetical protein
MTEYESKERAEGENIGRKERIVRKIKRQQGR